MTDTELRKQVGSFVSFALAMKPSILLQRHCDGEPLSDTAVEFTLSDKGALSRSELSSLEALMKKYDPIKKYLHITDSPEDKAGFNIATCAPTVVFQPDTDYKIVKINANQLKVAKEVAARVDRIYKLHSAGDGPGAKSAYADLHAYLGKQRTELVGEFKHVPEFTKAVGVHGTGRAARRADGDCGGMVIFIIIEIFIA